VFSKIIQVCTEAPMDTHSVVRAALRTATPPNHAILQVTAAVWAVWRIAVAGERTTLSQRCVHPNSPNESVYWL